MRRLFLLVLVLSSALAASVFSVEHPLTMTVGQDMPYLLHVTNASDSTSVSGATVKAYAGDTLLGTATTNAAGYASFPFSISETSSIAFSINKHGYNEYVVLQEVTAPAPPIVEIVVPATNNSTLVKSSGLFTLGSPYGSILLFVVGIIFVSLSGASYYAYRNYADNAGDSATILDRVASWMTGPLPSLFDDEPAEDEPSVISPTAELGSSEDELIPAENTRVADEEKQDFEQTFYKDDTYNGFHKAINKLNTLEDDTKYEEDEEPEDDEDE